jgi:hypothetical protein
MENDMAKLSIVAKTFIEAKWKEAGWGIKELAKALKVPVQSVANYAKELMDKEDAKSEPVAETPAPAAEPAPAGPEPIKFDSLVGKRTAGLGNGGVTILTQAASEFADEAKIPTKKIIPEHMQCTRPTKNR